MVWIGWDISRCMALGQERDSFCFAAVGKDRRCPHGLERLVSKGRFC